MVPKATKWLFDSKCSDHRLQELKIFARPLFISQLFPSFHETTQSKCPRLGHLHLEPVNGHVLEAQQRV